MEFQPLKRLFSSSSSSICQSCRSKLLQVPRRPFATTGRLRAEDEPPQTPRPPRRTPTSSSLFQNVSDTQAREQRRPSGPSSDPMDELSSIFASGSPTTPSRTGSRPGGGNNPSASSAPPSYADAPSLTGLNSGEPFVFHITTHKHNTHLSLTGPFPAASQLRGPHDRRRSISMSTGNIGFKKAGRGSYDAAFQLAAFVFGAINERDILPMVQAKGLEIRYRGFGKGREAVTKALMGSEGRWVKKSVVRVSDVTAVKFGGVRSKKPRRLG